MSAMPKLSESQSKALAERVLLGEKIPDLAREYGVSRQTVYEKLRKHREQARIAGLTKRELRELQIEQLVAANLDLRRQLAEIQAELARVRTERQAAKPGR